MKALYYPGWEQLEIRDLPKPVLSDGEALIRVSDCGICGSELDTFRLRSPRRTPPLIMGHEFCGVIEQVHSTEGNWQPGQRVIAHALVHCGCCAACLRGDTNLCIHRQIFGMQRAGAFAEYVAVPERVLVPWSEGTPSTTIVFAEPLANGINAMRQAPMTRRSRVIVIGAGPIGLMCLLAAKRLHYSSVIVADRVPERLEVAQRLGADKTVNVLEESLAEQIQKLWSANEAEFVIDAVGSSDTKQQSIELAEAGGGVVWVGLHQDMIQLSSYPLTLGQRCVTGTYSGSMTDLRQAVHLLSTENLDMSWATRYPLERGETAFRDMLLSNGRTIKAILQVDS